MLPPAIAVIIECQTSSKARTLQELRDVFKNFSATITPTSYFFDRRGKITFESSQDLDEDAILEQAIEAGALDVEIEEHGVAVVYTEPTSLASVATALETALGLKVESSEFVWNAKEDTKVEVDSVETEKRLSRFISKAFYVSHGLAQSTNVHRSYRGRPIRSGHLCKYNIRGAIRSTFLTQEVQRTPLLIRHAALVGAKSQKIMV